MAHDKHGRLIALGDKLETATGEVIRVQGLLDSAPSVYRTRDCTVVDPTTPTTRERAAAIPGGPISGGQGSGDQLVWGN